MSSSRAAFSGLKLKTLPISDGALFEEDQVVGHPREVLARVFSIPARHRLDPVGLGAIAVAGRQAVGPHHRPGGGAALAGHRRGRFHRIHPFLRRDAEQAQHVGFLGHVVGVPVAHLPVLQDAGAVALLLVGDLVLAGQGAVGGCVHGALRWVREDTVGSGCIKIKSVFVRLHLSKS